MLAIHDLLLPNCIDLQFPATGEEDTVRRAALLLKRNPGVTDPEKFCEAVVAREKLSSTAMGHGLAFPHARTDSVHQIVMAVARCVAPVSFAGGAQQVDLIFVIGTPPTQVRDYLSLLGKLARMLKAGPVKQRLMDAPNPAEFLRVLREATEGAA